ncbi:50S ribosomal protein L19 [Candidatus Babeliales bacterium]|nr:50S ribosomal protein L19 [Candidatus Babeliales bacterium]
MKSKKLNKETVQLLAVRDVKFPDFSIGDKIEVLQWVQEGDNKRTQAFVGNVIAKNKNAGSSTFTVRKIGADDVAIERIYPFYSPIIDSIKVLAKAKVRRAKLYYIRHKVGEAARIKEKVVRKQGQAVAFKAQSKSIQPTV